MHDTEDTEFELDINLADAGPAASGHATGTDDSCGSGNQPAAWRE